MNTTVLKQLGELSVKEFMADYWQQKPILIRGAFPHFKAPVTLDNVLEYCLTDEAQTRLIEQTAKPAKNKDNSTVSKDKPNWKLTHGPLDKLPPLSRKGWTVLLQGAHTASNELADLLGAFRFIPDARLDDLMISVASDGGGVGPHLDSYDVFLLQAHGRRHWRWGLPKSTALQDNEPLKLLKNFSSAEQAVLEPGDMLYLPPGWAHDGVAQDICMTFSIGFRASTQSELMSDYLAHLIDKVQCDDVAKGNSALKDTRRKPTQTPAKLETQEIAQYRQWIKDFKVSDRFIDEFLGQHLSEPRQHVLFEPPMRPHKLQKFATLAAKKGVRLHRATRALYSSKLFINGEKVDCLDKILQTLFDQRFLSGPVLAALSASNPAAEQLIYEWYTNGWLELA